MNELDLQRAITYEIGADGQFNDGAYATNWSLTLYHSNVKDELMSFTDSSGYGPSTTINHTDRSRHQGI